MYTTEIEKYRKEGSTNEWYIQELLDRCVLNLNPEQAFSEIGVVAEILSREAEWDIFLNHCQYILRLASIAKTTELPFKLKSNIEVFRSKIKELNLENHSEVKELYTWFRI